MDIYHFPTILLIVGYPLYWIELYFIKSPTGHTSFIAAFVSIVLFLFLLISSWSAMRLRVKEGVEQFKQLSLARKFFIAVGVFLLLVILAISLYAALFPLHLIQESDALNYHYTLPRQHLLLGSFKHIPWSSADLYLMPVQFALSPYWLCTELPNKFPQWVFLIGLLSLSAQLTYKRGGRNLASVLMVVFAIAGSHFVSIQMGTGMIDIVLCYLMIAALDSFISGKPVQTIVEFTFLFWSKPFMPIQFLGIILLICCIYWFLKLLGMKEENVTLLNTPLMNKEKRLKFQKRKVFILFLLLSFIIGGPFALKSIYYAGTPLFPIKTGMLKINQNIDYDSAHWKSIEEVSRKTLLTKDNYGYGRSLSSFVKHFWLISVPDKGVNNQYDYPVGLPYLLFLGPFLLYIFSEIRQRRFEFVSVFIIAYWFSWWLGIHQTRFLYIPIILMFILMVTVRKKYPVSLLMGLVISLSLVTISLYRNYQPIFGKTPHEVLRKRDVYLLERGKNVQNGKAVDLDFFDVAYADFPVNVINTNSIFVFEQ